MDTPELMHVQSLLREHQRARRTSAPYWLLWAVYASEAGYDYVGDEYWPSFEKQTPNWQYHDRPKVKDWLRKFQRSFNGVEPSGPWAEHFSIIAWPITHALLPRYLQRQFARLLFDLRFVLVSASLDAGSIGRLLAAHAPRSSTRLQAFLEQEELTGQIAAALLNGKSVDADALIHPLALNRVVGDLERIRSSREWLKETRRVVTDRFTGIGRGTYRPLSSTQPNPAVPPDTSRFVIRPDLFLRHSGDGEWSVLLRFKSLRPLATENKALRVFLNSTRCRLNGATDWKPAGWLLSGNRIGALRRWPDANIPLVRFERQDALMDHLLESEYRLTPRPLWLFRIGSDGIAHYIASPTVRPDNDYVVVATDDVPSDFPGLTSCRLECEGVQAFRVAVPSLVPEEATARLRDLGLEVARTIRVWPAGLPGRGWDGQGSTEWLTTESPCFGIAPDHPLDELSCRLDEGPEQAVATGPLGGTTFIRLPPLAAGDHLLTVEAHRSPALDDVVTTPPARGFVRLAVREPEPWTPGVASHPGLIVRSDPFDASLDLLWRNELGLSVNGPQGFTVRLHLKLHAADGRQVLSEHVANPMAIPITPDVWRRAFARFLDAESRAWKYLEASTCTLEINGDSLGACELRFEHHPSPLRWALGSSQRQTLVRLIDDSGQHDTTPTVRFFSMESPLDGKPLDAESAREGFIVPPLGGLYEAKHGRFEDAAVVSAPRAPRSGLKGLGVTPKVHVAAGKPAVREAFQVLRLWYNARHAGFLVDVRGHQVIRCIIDAIIRSVCGENWTRAEEDFTARPSSPDTLQALETLVDRRTQFGPSLGQQVGNENDRDISIGFAAEARRHHIPDDRDLCQLALRLAAHEAEALADSRFDARIDQLVDNPALLRGARLVSHLRKQGEAT